MPPQHLASKAIASAMWSVNSRGIRTYSFSLSIFHLFFFKDYYSSLTMTIQARKCYHNFHFHLSSPTAHRTKNKFFSHYSSLIISNLATPFTII
ncbi:hypothetical protein [Escherichia phage BI-EHEC]|nr:hypothetical protein [Escherichia phage BI-EHEC]